jgi:hypothetical protein
MARNKITDLRDHLFETLESLKDPDRPMPIDRARAIAEVAQTIINSAKVEVDLVKAMQGSEGVEPGSKFFVLDPPALDESRELPRLATAVDARVDTDLAWKRRSR